MADQRSITGQVHVQQDNRERVAYDLMMHIAFNEDDVVRKDRRYFLELFSQCRQVTGGTTPDRIHPPLPNK
jgi:hypothetical protein